MRIFVIAIALFFSIAGKAQHFPVYSQYLMNGLAINPAYAGSRDVLCVSAMYRDQWVGFPGAPVTGSFSAHMPLRNKTVNFGFQFINETIGVDNNFSFYGDYAFRFQLGNGHMALGTNLGFDLLKEDVSKITARQSEDIANYYSVKNSMMPNAGVGMFYYNPLFSAGLSIPRLISYKSAGDNKLSPYSSAANYNYLLSGALLVKVCETFKLKPSTLIRYTANSPTQFDLNCNAIFLKDGLLWVGAAYRSSGAMVGLVEYQINTQVRMGYSYDYSLGKLSNSSGGSHEIMLRYEFRYKVDAINPKYF